MRKGAQGPGAAAPLVEHAHSTHLNSGRVSCSFLSALARVTYCTAKPSLPFCCFLPMRERRRAPVMGPSAPRFLGFT